MTDDELTREEHDRLAGARVPVTPPAGLEDRTMRALRERGLVRRPRPWSSAFAASPPLPPSCWPSAGE